MKFRYQKRPSDSSGAFPNRKNILRPIIPVGLWNKGNFITTDALIDSGADDCIFSAEIGEAIGLKITQGKKNQYMGVSGKSVDVYFHRINIEIGGHKFDNSYIGFSFHTGFKGGLLGQEGFFNLFKIIFNLPKEEIELRRRGIL